ncbi:hypothetical protein CsSME_00012293 [Camellia sinensis var. sinensis]
MRATRDVTLVAMRCKEGGREGLEWWVSVEWVIGGGGRGDKVRSAKKEGKVGNMVGVQRNIGDEQFWKMGDQRNRRSKVKNKSK